MIFLIRHRLAPLIFGIFPRNLNSKMRKPAVLCRPVPMLHARFNIDHVSGNQLSRFFAPFLIIPFSGNANQNLSAALGRMVNVPVISAPRLKSHIKNSHLLGGQRSQIALTAEIFCKCIVFSPVSNTLIFFIPFFSFLIREASDCAAFLRIQGHSGSRFRSCPYRALRFFPYPLGKVRSPKCQNSAPFFLCAWISE